MAGSGKNGDKSPYTWIIVLVVIVLVIVGILLAMKKRSAGKTGGFYRGGSRGRQPSHVMLPAGRGPHAHEVDLDETGFGVSSLDRGHRHVVENTIDIGLEQDGDVAPADHQHDLTAYIVDV